MAAAPQLDAVRRVREARRDELRGRLADAFRAAEVLQAERAQVAEELLGVQEARRHAAASPAMNVTHVLDAQRYELVLRSQEEALAEKSRMVAEEIERRRSAVTEAERDVKTLDLLEERRRREQMERERRAEAKETDEIALLAVCRSRAAAPGGDAAP